MPSEQVLNALENLHKELQKLEPAIKHVETAQEVTQMVKSIPKLHMDLLENINKSDGEFKKGLQLSYEKDIKEITLENKALQKVTSEIQSQVTEELTSLSIVKETIQAFHERVERINFPERLDKLDVNVSGVVLAIQSIQNRVDNLERNIADRIKELTERQKDAAASIETKINNTAKKQQVLTYVTWLLIIAGIVVYFVLK